MEESPLDSFAFTDDTSEVSLSNKSSDYWHLFFCSVAVLLERMAYYGIRVTFILYLTSATIAMPREEAYNIYELFSIGILVFSFIGGFLGDTKFGNKRSIILGGLLAAIGAFALCFKSHMVLYFGFAFVCIGNGLYKLNFRAFFGKYYLDKIEILDSRFTFIYIMINIGAFLGSAYIGMLGEAYDWSYSFIAAGLAMIISVALITFLKDNSSSRVKIHNKTYTNQYPLIFLVVFMTAIIGGAFAIAESYMDTKTINFPQLTFDGVIKNYYLSMLESSLLLFFGLIMTILWSYYYSSQCKKLSLGFILGVLFIGLLWVIPEIPSPDYIGVLYVAVGFYALAEIFIAPLIDSVIIQNANPKYITTIMALAILPGLLVNKLVGELAFYTYENPELGLLVVFTIMVISIIGLVLFDRRKNKKLLNPETLL